MSHSRSSAPSSRHSGTLAHRPPCNVCPSRCCHSQTLQPPAAAPSFHSSTSTSAAFFSTPGTVVSHEFNPDHGIALQGFSGIVAFSQARHRVPLRFRYPPVGRCSRRCSFALFPNPGLHRQRLLGRMAHWHCPPPLGQRRRSPRELVPPTHCSSRLQ